MEKTNIIDRGVIFRERFTELVGNSTQEEVAKIINTSRQNVGNWLNGKSRPDIFALSEISRGFNVSTDYLLGLSDVMSNDTTLQGICEYTGLSEKAIDLLVSEKSNPSGITDLINLLMGEYADNKSLGGYADNSKKSVLKSIVDYLSVDPISVNSNTYYINKNGELRNPAPNSAEADFSSIVGLSNINIGEVIDSVLFDEIKKTLKDIKSKQTE